jgi:hypothetical protein
VAAWREFAIPLVEEVCTLQGAIGRVEAEYFEGHAVLFPGFRDSLEFAVSQLQTVIGIYNDIVACLDFLPEQKKPRRGRAAPSPDKETSGAARLWIDLAEAKASLRAEIEELTATMVVMAKAEALAFVGERETGLDFVEKYIAH